MKLDIRSSTERWTFWTGFYDRSMISKLISRLPPDPIVLDVGANIGFYSVALGFHLKDSRAQVFAFEPVMENYERLRENVALNSLEQTVIPLRVALGSSEGSVVLSRESDRGATTGNAVVNHEATPGDTPSSCRLTTLDCIARELSITNCHLLKMDIEGYEYKLLQGASEFISEHRPLIVLELNSYWMAHFGWSSHDLMILAETMGYRTLFSERGRVSVSVPPSSGIATAFLVPHETDEDQWLQTF